MRFNDYDAIPKRYAHMRSAIVCVRYREADKYKTAIPGSAPNLFMVVTRVSVITAQLWLDYRNALVKNDQPDMKKYWTEEKEQKRYPVLPTKINWFIALGKYRREQDELIKKMVA